MYLPKVCIPFALYKNSTSMHILSCLVLSCHKSHVKCPIMSYEQAPVQPTEGAEWSSTGMVGALVDAPSDDVCRCSRADPCVQNKQSACILSSEAALYSESSEHLLLTSIPIDTYSMLEKSLQKGPTHLCFVTCACTSAALERILACR